MGHIEAKKMALCGVLAALAVVFMCLGTLIPLATFICPLLCMAVLSIVLRLCGARMAWAWYICVAILTMMLSPDREAAAVFVFLGYYPILKPRLDRLRLRVLWKLLLFNAAIGGMYATLIWLLGMQELLTELTQLGTLMSVVTLLLGNVCLFIFDLLLTRMGRLK